MHPLIFAVKKVSSSVSKSHHQLPACFLTPRKWTVLLTKSRCNIFNKPQTQHLTIYSGESSGPNSIVTHSGVLYLFLVCPTVAPGMLPAFPPGMFPFWGPFPAVPPPHAAPPGAAAAAEAPGAPHAPQNGTEATQGAGECSVSSSFTRPEVWFHHHQSLDFYFYLCVCVCFTRQQPAHIICGRHLHGSPGSRNGLPGIPVLLPSSSLPYCTLAAHATPSSSFW